MTVWFGVLGPLEVRDARGEPVRVIAPVRRQLLAALLCRGGSTVAAAALGNDLWGDAPPRSAAKTLQSHVARLRDDLGREAGRYCAPRQSVRALLLRRRDRRGRSGPDSDGRDREGGDAPAKLRARPYLAVPSGRLAVRICVTSSGLVTVRSATTLPSIGCMAADAIFRANHY
jgi:hypothetical protein